jgi:hypothetical protein
MEFAGGIPGSSCVVPNRNARSIGCGGTQWIKCAYPALPNRTGFGYVMAYDLTPEWVRSYSQLGVVLDSIEHLEWNLQRFLKPSFQEKKAIIANQNRIRC